MTALNRNDLYSLEQYAEIRNQFRDRVMAHKRPRRIALGDHVALYFEDALTMQYQIQEMLRIEKIFEADGIQDELDVYNPLIPDGNNWKATLMIEYADVDERRQQLARLVGIEQQIWIRIGELPLIRPIANEDLDRTTEEKTASVHFLRFELDQEQIAALHAGAALSMGVDHPAYQVERRVDDESLSSLLQDLDPAPTRH
jgi:hypothetical protein